MRRALLVYASALLLVTVAVTVYFRRWSVGETLSTDQRANVLDCLRAALDGGGACGGDTGDWHGVVRLYCDGRVVARSDARSEQGSGPKFDPNLARAAHDDNGGKPFGGCTMRADVIVERGRILGWDPALAISVVPGLDGLQLDFSSAATGHTAYLLPDELFSEDLLTHEAIAPEIDLKLGLDGKGALTRLARMAAVDTATWARVPHSLARIRTQSFVAPYAVAAGAIGPSRDPGALVVRHHDPAPRAVTPESLRAAARAGGDYLVAHQHEDGHFDYFYYPLMNAVPDGSDYSYPRHAGATYFLASLAGATHDDKFARAAASGLAFLESAHPPGCDRPDLACVGAPGDPSVDIGSAALALVAAAEYQRATGDARFERFSRRLGRFLLAMQRDDGDFNHIFVPSTATPDTKTRLLYYSGEAAYGLAKLAHATHGTAEALAVDRALGALTTKSYDSFAGNFFYGEDHWTCLAVAEAYEQLPEGPRRERYGDFCEGFSAFLRRQQFRPGDAVTRAMPDVEGAYGFGPWLAPHTAPAGSRSESVAATARVARLRHRDDRVLVDQLRESMSFLLGRQIRRETAWDMPDPARAVGGFFMSDANPYVRIDLLQHAGSAMLATAALLDEEGSAAGE